MKHSLVNLQTVGLTKHTPRAHFEPYHNWTAENRVVFKLNSGTFNGKSKQELSKASSANARKNRLSIRAFYLVNAPTLYRKTASLDKFHLPILLLDNVTPVLLSLNRKANVIRPHVFARNFYPPLHIVEIVGLRRFSLLPAVNRLNLAHVALADCTTFLPNLFILYIFLLLFLLWKTLINKESTTSSLA